MKVVIDTNVLISGIFWKGQPNKVLNIWREGKITPVVSADMLSEFTKVMNDFKIRLPQDLIREWINMILKNSIWVEPKEKLDVVKDDPEDNMFLEAAVAGDAEYIISQDKHLLKLKSYSRIRIVKPEEFNKQFS
jgi:hypothetical protein